MQPAWLNRIIANAIDSALYIPLESLHSQFDSITFVFKKDGLDIIKQEVIVGETNVNDAIVKGGLEENEKIYVSMPIGLESQKVNLLPEMNGKRRKKEDIKIEEVAPAGLVVKKISQK